MSRIPLRAGRSFDERDTTNAPPRGVVSATLARRVFGDRNPVGHTLSLLPVATPLEIVGVVGDVKHLTLDESDLPTIT